MSTLSRFGLAVATALVILIFCWHEAPILAQPADKKEDPPPKKDEPPKKEEKKDDTVFIARVKLPIDRTAFRQVTEVQRLADEESWREVALLAQSLIEEKGDKFLIDMNSQCFNVRSELNKVLRRLPKDGIEFYERSVGAEARKLLDQAKRESDSVLLAEVAHKYQFSKAGVEAIGLLGSLYMDRGQYTMAAVLYERYLQQGPKLNQLPPVMLFQMALAFGRGGDAVNCGKVWREFEAKWKANKALQASPHFGDLVELEKMLKPLGTGPGSSRNDWMCYCGDHAHTAFAEAATLALESSFKQDLCDTSTRDLLNQAANVRLSPPRPALNGYHPLAFGGKAYVRGHDFLWVIDLKANEVAWSSSSMQLGLNLSNAARTKGDTLNFEGLGQLPQWANNYLQNGPTIFYDNGLLGTMSADAERVYVIDDLAIPPHPQFNRRPGFGLPANQTGSKFLFHNRLRAYDHRTGKAAWEIGSSGDEKDPFNDTAFLGAPIVLADRVYAMAESRGELRLVCLRPEVDRTGPKAKHSVELVWSKPLGVVDLSFFDDPLRRTQASHLAYSDGVMVCPTNAGTVIAIDLLTQAPLWAYVYEDTTAPAMPLRPGQPRPLPRISPAWNGSVPIIKDGKVVIAPPDSDALHCVDLRDGSLEWKIKRGEGDCYIGGLFEGLVLIVGRDRCRAVELETGKEIWSIETGAPSGRGIFSGSVYMLPAQAGEILLIDVANGKIKERIKTAKGEVPGNLLIHDGYLISQSMTAVEVFPMKR